MAMQQQSIDLRFAPLQEAHLPAVVAIESAAYVFPWTMGNFRDSIVSGYTCLGVWTGDELIGYAIVMSALNEAHLLNLAIAAHWQQRGVGRQVLQYLVDQSRAKKCDMLYLEVRPSNIAGNRLYDQFGFAQLGVRRDYYPAVCGREDALFLGLDLALVAP